MTKFAGMVSATNVTFTGITGRNLVIAAGHVNDERIRELMRETQAAFRSGDAAEGNRLWQEMTDLADIPAAISKATAGKVTVVGDEVHYDGTPVHNAITQRILWTIEQKYDPQSYMLFLDNLMENPSKRAVDELFGFLEACQMGITDDGHLIAYKRVRADYMDIYTGTVRNRIGDKPSMPRNGVDEDKDRTCSAGLHFCSFTYLPSYGAGPGNTVMIIKINPRDVVAIPSDYNNAKGRCCLYEVIGEVEGDDLADILSKKSVWSSSDQQTHFNPNKVRPDRKSILERLIRTIREETGEDLPDLTGDTTLDDLTFAVRSRLQMAIDDEFGVHVDADRFEEDDLTLASLADDIEVDLGGETDDFGTDDLDDLDDLDDEDETDNLPETDEDDDVGQSGEGAFVPADGGHQPVPVYTADTAVVSIFAKQDGNTTRWIAECPACNGGKGWRVEYARKRDARRGIKREFGDTVVVREID